MEIPFVDSHTGGEPTRVIPEGGIELRGPTMAERRHDLATRLNPLRRAIACEPRGNDILVGAVLTPPVSPGSDLGVVYFDNAGVIGMCGHGSIGVVETLRYLRRIAPGSVRIDTAVGTVEATLHANGDVELRNVPSRRYRGDVAIQVEGLGEVVGDVAFGGNWFFIVRKPQFEIGMDHLDALADATLRIRRALGANGVAGEDGLIDHVILEGDAAEGADSRNFVMCPGGAYDRSPCGTGTSANMAARYAAGSLLAGQWFVQESVTGSRFRGRIEPTENGLIPTIVGRASVTAVGTLIFDPSDPLAANL